MTDKEPKEREAPVLEIEIQYGINPDGTPMMKTIKINDNLKKVLTYYIMPIIYFIFEFISDKYGG